MTGRAGASEPCGTDLAAAVGDAVARVAAAAPGFEVGLGLRCPTTGIWQVAATAHGGVSACARALRDALPHLAISRPLAQFGERAWHLPMWQDGRLVACLTLIADRQRSLPDESVERLLVLAREAGDALEAAREQAHACRTRRLRAAARELPRLFLTAGDRDETCALVLRAIGHALGDVDARIVMRGGAAPIAAGIGDGPPGRLVAAERIATSAAQLGRPVLEATPTSLILSPRSRQVAAVPLRGADGEPCGALVVDVPALGRRWEERDLDDLQEIANATSLALELYRSRRAARVAAELDPETGCATSASLGDQLEDALERGNGSGSHTAILLLRLLAAADEEGSARAFGERLAAIGAAEGIAVARLGPTEFAVLAEHCAARNARLLSARLRLVAQHGLGDARSAAVCAGIAVAPTHGETPRRLLEEARDALAQAMSDGPNREVMAQPARNGASATTLSERLTMLRTLARLVDERHHAGAPRSAAVAKRARNRATVLEHTPGEIDVATLAGELHDIGLALLPSLVAGDAASAHQRRAVLAGHLVASSGFPQVGAAIARLHEPWGGNGRPGGLAGEQAPRAASVLAVAHRFEQELGQANRGPDAVRAALAAVVSERGAALAPDVVDALASTLAVDAAAPPLADVG
jgi:GGDEF domain-containing protein